MVDWWSESEHAITECLGEGGTMSPEELALRLGMSHRDAIAFICMLAREGKLRIHLVGVEQEPAVAAAATAAWEHSA